MPDAQPLRDGDRITIQHAGGQRAEVIFCGLFGNKYDQAYVRWPMAGEYKVKLDTGQLTPSKVRMWKVCEADLRRLVATMAFERVAAKERMKSRRAGTLQ